MTNDKSQTANGKSLHHTFRDPPNITPHEPDQSRPRARGSKASASAVKVAVQVLLS
jgi:hypothetical protein